MAPQATGHLFLYLDANDQILALNPATGRSYPVGSSPPSSGGEGGYVAKTGDTMTGPLILAADPASDLGAGTKHYIDHVDNMKVNTFGDVMTGPLSFAAPDGSGSVELSCVNGDLVATAISGPNTGKSVNLTYGKWT
jgi:hypothetical protein